MAEASSQQQYAKSRLSRMRNVRANAAGMLRRAPSFLPESCNSNCVAVGGTVGGDLGRVGSTKLKRSNSSSSTFYVQLPSTERKICGGVNRPPFISSWHGRQRQIEPESCHDSETSGCESGSRRHSPPPRENWFFKKIKQKHFSFFLTNLT